MASTAVYEGEIDVPEDAIQTIDEAVIATGDSALPIGTKPKDIVPHGASYWTRTARVDVELPDESQKSYFLKVSTKERGQSMLRGEFESMQAIAQVVPAFVPFPVAWGTYASKPSIHFFLCAFQDFSDDALDAAKFCEKVAQMHLRSLSPTGQYGFHVTTHHGNLPQNNKWNDSWESFFAESLKSMFELEEQTQGTSSEVEELRGPLFRKVIPRLLRPLETGGRNIKPSLIHGDLWYGNASTDLDLDEPMVYDACSFYAHNEYELGSWRPARNKFGKAFNKAYHRHFHIADPVEDYDDRVALYSVRFHMHASALYSGNADFREMMIDEMRRLVEKYPEGFEEWEQQDGKQIGAQEIYGSEV